MDALQPACPLLLRDAASLRSAELAHSAAEEGGEGRAQLQGRGGSVTGGGGGVSYRGGEGQLRAEVKLRRSRSKKSKSEVGGHLNRIPGDGRLDKKKQGSQTEGEHWKHHQIHTLTAHTDLPF